MKSRKENARAHRQDLRLSSSHAEYAPRIIVGEYAAGIEPLLRREEGIDVGGGIKSPNSFAAGEKHLAPVRSSRKRLQRLGLHRAQEAVGSAVPRIDVDVDEHHVTAEVRAEQDALRGTDDAARIIWMGRGETRHPGEMLCEELRELREPIPRYRKLHVQPVVPVARAQPDPTQYLFAVAPIGNHAVADEERRREGHDAGEPA